MFDNNRTYKKCIKCVGKGIDRIVAYRCDHCDGSGSIKNDDEETPCIHCNGSGIRKYTIDCKKCDGHGKVKNLLSDKWLRTSPKIVMSKNRLKKNPNTEKTSQKKIEYDCYVCNGSGIYKNKKCRNCKGSGKLKRKSKHFVHDDK